MSTAAASNSYVRILPYILTEWRPLCLILLMTVCVAGASALMPWPLKIIVDFSIGGLPLPDSVRSTLEFFSLTSTPELLVVAAALLSLLLFAISATLDAAITWNWSAAGQRMVYDLAADIFARLQRLSLSFHNRRTVGDSLSRLTGDSWCTYKVAWEILISPTQQLFTILTVSVIAWNLDPVLTAIMLAVTPALVASARFFGEKLKARSRMQREAKSQMMSFVHQTMKSIPVVHAFTSERRNLENFSLLSDSVVFRAQQGVLVKHAYQFINGLSMSLGIAVILYFGGLRIFSNQLTVGSLIVFIAYAQTLRGAFGALLENYGNLKTAEASIDRALEVLDSEEAVPEAEHAQVLVIDASRPGLSVEFEDVSFGYEPGKMVLEGINFHARCGETIALVGATGAGKSTLASLIPRFFDPCSGRVLINGVDAKKLTLRSLRQQMSLVLQDHFILPLSVAENIAYGNPAASRQEIESAAVSANAHGFIKELPDGYETIVGEQGATLSGGQRQRLSIARALLKDAPLLILDEPTSALDTDTENLLLEALERLMVNRTTFIIAHRLSTIRNADRLIVLENGRIAENGTHNELMEKRGQYFHYVSMQSASLRAGGDA